MKIFFYLLAILPILAHAQYDIPEPETEKTQFRPSVFQSNYLTQETLVKLLNQSHELISNESRSMVLVAKDLYYEQSGIYRREKEINDWIKQEYLITNEQKIEKLDSALHLGKKWLHNMKPDHLLYELINPLNYGFEFSIKGNSIYAVGPQSYNPTSRSIYCFEFNSDKRIEWKKLGRINSFNDTLYWMTTNYEYKGNLRYKEIFKKCNDAKCKQGYELETKTYLKGQLHSNLKQSFSRQNNEIYKEEVTNYYYSDKILDSSKTNTFYINSQDKRFDISSVSEFKFDDNKRLVYSKKSTWDKDGKLTEQYTEELKYEKNKYIYTYIESLKTEMGKEILPLQYELTYTFL